MANFLAPLINTQQFDANGDPLSGGLIEVYLAGSSTPATTTSDKAGAVPNTWPITLNTLGLNTQGAVWITGGSAYKYVIKNAAGVTLRTIDNISGINDTTVAIDQWIPYQGTPTYVSATSFTVAGDQTQIFQQGRRVRTLNTGGLITSTIVSSTYGAPNTTVTVANDSGVLDAGLSQVSYGIISVQDSSLNGFLLSERTITSGSGTYTPTPGTTFIEVELVGGGASGGGTVATGAAQAGIGGGGGGGGYVYHRMTSGFSGVGYSVGVGGAPALGAVGNAGGATTFGALSAGGGGGGAIALVTPPSIVGGGAGGASSGGTLNVPGAPADPSVAISTTVGYGSSGGGSYFVASGGGATSASDGAGAPSGAYGAGGGGTYTQQSSVARLSGAGAGGVIRIREYA